MTGIDTDMPAEVAAEDVPQPQAHRATWNAVMQQLSAARAIGAVAKPRWRPNPRPPGVVQSGSATDAVWQLLQGTPKRQWRRAQLVALTGRSESAVDWALLYLRRQGRIEVLAASVSRQFRYRLKEGA